MDSRGKTSIIAMGCGALMLLCVGGTLIQMATGDHRVAQTEAPPKRAEAPKEDVKEVDKPGSSKFLAALVIAKLYPNPIVDFAHLSASPDILTVTVIDEWRDHDKAARRKAAKGIQAMWAIARKDEQPDPTKCRVIIVDRQGDTLAESSRSDGTFVKLSDDQ